MYWSFKIGKTNVVTDKSAKPTLINKYVQDEGKHKYLDGFINYKNILYTVLDLSLLYNEKKPKKFDGLMLFDIDDKHFAVKYEGFCEEVDQKNGSVELLPSDLLKLI